MSVIAALLIATSSAQGQYVPPPRALPVWQPTARYVEPGQDEPGYRAWYMAAPWRASAVRTFNDYLETYGVGGVVPTWQLLRTASDWQRCGAPPFEVAPASEWPNIVQTLRYVRDRVIPTIGPVEPVSAYRNPALNRCAGGANESAHRYMQAVDLVPLRPITREALMRNLCAVHRAGGEPYGVGLGFYAYLRFHVDTRRFRTWGSGNAHGAEQCRRKAVPPAAPQPSAPADQPIAAATAAPDMDSAVRQPQAIAPR